MKMNTYTVPTTIPCIAPLGRPVMLEDIRAAMEDNCPLAVFPVVGDCLEAAGIMEGDRLGVDFSHYPAPPRYKSEGGDGSFDLCLCYAIWPGMKEPTVMFKAYDGVWGGRQMVGTKYDIWKGGELRLNVGMFAKEIFGVVFAAWDKDGVLKWRRDPSEFPEELNATSTIHGVNVGDPMPVRKGVSV